jgi:hypothetical protein
MRGRSKKLRCRQTPPSGGRNGAAILEGIYRAAALVCPQRRHRTPLRGTTADGKSKLELMNQRRVFSDALH